jgi:hypothetical protein
MQTASPVIHIAGEGMIVGKFFFGIPVRQNAKEISYQPW